MGVVIGKHLGIHAIGFDLGIENSEEVRSIILEVINKKYSQRKSSPVYKLQKEIGIFFRKK